MPFAMAITEFGDADVLRPLEVPEPDAGPGQLRVRVRAAGVNLIDCRIRSGFMQSIYPASFPQVLGNEFAGVVDQTGPDVTGFAVGDEVLGFAFMQSYTEVLVVGVDQVVAKPADLSWEAAGSLSAVGQTAYNALRALQVSSGQTVLVHAAAGGVGTVAVQLARAFGATTVIGTASPGNHDYLRSLGAEPVAYGAGLADRVRALAPAGVDVALDAHGGQEALDVSLDLVSDRKRIGTIANFRAAGQHGITMLRGERSVETLAALTRLYDDGGLRLHVQRTYPLRQAADAHREAEAGHVRGKLALVV
ncbi:NADP-dependent oxidoreductase [Micromonospora zamorensis]|uniref:NADP-dependent oxidoreductase n=1 Tax=Micromonospora zamorensis TaxID=709883 RepID=UPI0037A99622